MRSILDWFYGNPKYETPRKLYRLPDGTLSETTPHNPASIRDSSISRIRAARDYHSQHADKWNNIADDAGLRAREHEAVYSALNETLTRLTNPEWFGNTADNTQADLFAETKHYTADEALTLAEDLQRELETDVINVVTVTSREQAEAMMRRANADFIGNTGFQDCSIASPTERNGAIPPTSGLMTLNVVDNWDDVKPYDPKPRYTGDDADFVSPIDAEPLDALREPDADDADPLLDASDIEHDQIYGVEKEHDRLHNHV